MLDSALRAALRTAQRRAAIMAAQEEEFAPMFARVDEEMELAEMRSSSGAVERARAIVRRLAEAKG